MAEKKEMNERAARPVKRTRKRYASSALTEQNSLITRM